MRGSGASAAQVAAGIGSARAAATGAVTGAAAQQRGGMVFRAGLPVNYGSISAGDSMQKTHPESKATLNLLGFNGGRSRRMRGGKGVYAVGALPTALQYQVDGTGNPILSPLSGAATTMRSSYGDSRISHVGIEPGARWFPIQTQKGGSRRRRRRGGQTASSMGNSLGNLWSGFTTGASDLWNKTKRAASSTMNTTPAPAMGGRRRRKMRGGGDEPYCYTHDCDT